MHGTPGDILYCEFEWHKTSLHKVNNRRQINVGQNGYAEFSDTIRIDITKFGRYDISMLVNDKKVATKSFNAKKRSI